MAATAVVYDRLFHGGTHPHGRPPYSASTIAFPSRTPHHLFLNPNLSILPNSSSSSSTTTRARTKPMPGNEFQNLFDSSFQAGSKLPRDVRTYNHEIKALCRTGRIKEAIRVVEEDMALYGVTPNRYTYDIIVEGCCREGMIDLAVAFLPRIVAGGGRGLEGSSCRPDVQLYTIVIDKLWEHGQREAAVGLVGKMLENGVTPDDVTYNTLISKLWKDGWVSEALELAACMVVAGIMPNEVTYNTLISKLWKDGWVCEALELAACMVEAGIMPNVVTYNSLISKLGKDGWLYEALELAVCMVEARIMPDEVTYNTLISKLWKDGWVCEALELAVCMVVAGIMPNVVTYRTLVSELMKLHKVEAMEAATKLFSLSLISKQTLHELTKSTNLLPTKLPPTS